jgi:glyoxalase family protein
MQLTGIHHLTAVSADASGNVAFYAGTLGMRLVKKTVNQDDVSAYHLFYADALASPGTDVTFFDWPAAPERRGNHSITRTALRVAGEPALRWWAARFAELGVKHGAVETRDGRLTLDFEDPEGQRLSLVDDGGVGAAHPWDRSPVPVEHQIRGLGPITMSVPDLRPTEIVLTQIMNMRNVRDYPDPESPKDRVYVYAMGEGGPAAELHIALRPDLAPAQPGAGGVHHVAFRTPNEAQYDAWADRLQELRVPNSGKVDRYYFRSLYFREPNGILFEIATDGPGFATDEPMEALGERLALPPFLEPRRAEIEAGLKPL